MRRRKRFGDCPGLELLEGRPLVGFRLPQVERVEVSAPAPVVRSRLREEPAPPVVLTGPTQVGRVALNHRGFGFVTVGDLDYFLPPQKARQFLTGDLVEFQPNLSPGLRAGAREVQDAVLLERPTSVWLGEVRQRGRGYVLEPDEPCFIPLALSDVDGSSVAPGEVVAVRVAPGANVRRGRFISVTLEANLGLRTRPEFDLDYALVKHDLADKMPAAVIAEADGLAAAHHAEAFAPEPNADFTAIPFVTIDGKSTRDFDDAVFARRTDDGWEVKVAIADVSWYVREGSELNAWAASRATSVYLPGRVVPMLPESLSNELCSLMPLVPRRAVVLTMQLSPEGAHVSHTVERGWIRSAARLTYDEMADFMAGDTLAVSGLQADVLVSLSAMTCLYPDLVAQRHLAGKLDFDEPEPHLAEDGSGGSRIAWETRTEAHKLVEELMLLANRAAASELLARYGQGLFRHQPPPAVEDWEDLRGWAASYDVELPGMPCMRALSGLIACLPEAEDQAAASVRIRSAMQPARYAVQTGEATGHFSLSFAWYTHFTSPIRRYADLLVHRLLLAPAGYQLSEHERQVLEDRAARCSDRALAAKMAERQVWDSLKRQAFFADVPAGAVFKARIVRATRRGLRVVIQGWQVAAWVSSESLVAAGGRFDDASGWTGPIAGQFSEGALLPLTWVEYSLERPAYPEIITAPAVCPLTAGVSELKAA